MDNYSNDLRRIEEKLNRLTKEKKNGGDFFSKMLPVLSTIVLGAASVFIAWNQSQTEKRFMENKRVQDSINIVTQTYVKDHQYFSLVYQDLFKEDSLKKNAALKLVPIMSEEVNKVMLGIIEMQNVPLSKNESNAVREIENRVINAKVDSEITIGIHRLNFSKKNDSIPGFIEKLGKDYQLIGNFYHKERASWMANSSTVFYYGGDKSKQRAMEIADFLGKYLEIDFAVSKGAGLGVDKSRKEYHHFVHIVSK